MSPTAREHRLPAGQVPAGPVRDHIAALRARGATLPWIAAQSGLHASTVGDVHSGRRTGVQAATANAVLAVDPPTGPVRRVPGVPAGPIRAVLQRRIGRGATATWIAAKSGVPLSVVSQVLRGERRTVRPETAEALARVPVPKEKVVHLRGVPAGPVRNHLQAKVDQGATLKWLEAQSGVTESTIQSVLAGERPGVYRRTAERLLAVTATPPVPAKRVEPGPTIERVRELTGEGWSLVDIGRAAGLSPSTLLERNMASGVSAQTERRVAIAHQRLHGRPGGTPRTYPWIVELAEGHTVAEIARGSGAAYESVRRLLLGRPVARATARAVCAWLVAQRPLPEAA